MSEQKLTDANGEALFTLESGVYKYTATKSGLKTETGNFEVTDSAKSIDITLQQAYAVTFTVEDSVSADPVPGATIDIAQAGIILETDTTDSLGEAVFELLPGTYDYTVTESNYQTYTGSVTVVDAPVAVGVSFVEVAVTLALATAPSGGEIVDIPVAEVTGNHFVWRGWEIRALDSDIVLRRLRIYAKYTANYLIWVTDEDNGGLTGQTVFRKFEFPATGGDWATYNISPLVIPRYALRRIWIWSNLEDGATYPEESVAIPDAFIPVAAIQYTRTFRAENLFTGTGIRNADVVVDWAPLIDFGYSEG